MRSTSILLSAVAVVFCHAAAASAQEFRFDRTIDVAGAATLDVSTIRGKIDVAAGQPGRVVVAGLVTVRLGWNVPADAVEIAKRVAAAPPIQRDGQTVRLRPPSASEEQRAVTVSYRVEVPPATTVTIVTDSGAMTVRDVSGTVTARTQSSTVALRSLGGAVEVNTGSGAVTAESVTGSLRVTTGSSAFTGRDLGGDLRVRTSSGSIDATVAGPGDVDVETGSSAIRVAGARGGVTASTRSGHVSLSGEPVRAWTASSGSGSVDVTIASNASFSLDAHSESGDALLDGGSLQGKSTKGRVTGQIGSGGPLVRLNSRSGSIKVRIGR